MSPFESASNIGSDELWAAARQYAREKAGMPEDGILTAGCKGYGLEIGGTGYHFSGDIRGHFAFVRGVQGELTMVEITPQ